LALLARIQARAILADLAGFYEPAHDAVQASGVDAKPLGDPSDGDAGVRGDQFEHLPPALSRRGRRPPPHRTPCRAG
jgi:hypothetical protein